MSDGDKWDKLGYPALNRTIDIILEAQAARYRDLFDRVNQAPLARYERLAELVEAQAVPYRRLAERIEEIHAAPLRRLSEQIEEIHAAPFRRLSEQIEGIHAEPLRRISERIEEVQAAPLRRLTKQVESLQSASFQRLAEQLQEVAVGAGVVGIPAVSWIIESAVAASSVDVFIGDIELIDLLNESGLAPPAEIEPVELSVWFRGVLAGLVRFGGPILLLQVLLIMWFLAAEVGPDTRTRFVELVAIVSLALVLAPEFRKVADKVEPAREDEDS